MVVKCVVLNTLAQCLAIISKYISTFGDRIPNLRKRGRVREEHV